MACERASGGSEGLRRSSVAREQDDFAFGVAPQRAADTEDFLQRRHSLPPKVGKQGDSRLFDKLIFGIGMGHKPLRKERQKFIAAHRFIA